MTTQKDIETRLADLERQSMEQRDAIRRLRKAIRELWQTTNHLNDTTSYLVELIEELTDGIDLQKENLVQELSWEELDSYFEGIDWLATG